MQFEEWMAAEGPALKRAAILLCRDEHEADDLVQETFVRIYTVWARVSDLDNPAAYAQKTLTNVYRSWWRRVRVDRSKSHLFAVGGAGLSGMDEVDDRSALATWLRSLGAKQRAAVVWRYYFDLPVSEIATLLGCRESTVRAQLARALATIRRTAADQEQALSRRSELPDVP